MTKYRPKLHPSTCFPSNPCEPSTQNRLFIRVASNQTRHNCPRLTFIGINTTTYSAIAALLAFRQSTSIESIKLFDVSQKLEARTTLNDLQLIGLFNKTNTRLEWAQSYWETKDSTIIIINVQHNQLENESISTWTQINASLIESIISQVCIYSPHATLVICTQPNELMTYVASRVSKFPSGRVFGLGASVDTAYAHRTILDQIENIHGYVKGFFVLGNGTIHDSCTTVLANNITINGIHCSDIHSKLLTSQINTETGENQLISRKRKPKDRDILKLLNNNEHIYSNVTRRLPIITDLISCQKTVTKYLLSNSTIPHSKSRVQESIKIPLRIKPRSNWVEAMLILHIIHALINGSEFQSNLAVNIAPITHSKDVFINYPTILGSSNRGIEYMLPFHHAQNILKHPSFLIPYEKLQSKIAFSKSKD